jgi:hypothetical protein
MEDICCVVTRFLVFTRTMQENQFATSKRAIPFIMKTRVTNSSHIHRNVKIIMTNADVSL